MARIPKILEQATRNPQNLKYRDFVRLIEAFGFKKVRQKGSHVIYKLDRDPPIYLNIQPIGNLGKPYQVRDFLTKVRDYNLNHA